MLSVQQLLTKIGMNLMPRPPYSADLTASNIFFFVGFLGWKKVLKGKPFAEVEEDKQKIAEALKGIKIEFKNGFEQWKKMS